MPSKKLNSMMKILSPISLHIDSIDSTWKLAQAKPQESRVKVADKMMLYSSCKQLTLGTELASLSALHREPFTGVKHEINSMYATATKKEEQKKAPFGGIVLSYELIGLFVVAVVA